MSLLRCPNCERINDSGLTPFHLADEVDLGRITVYHCVGCSSHFRDQIVAGIPIIRPRSISAQVQNSQ